MKRSWSSIETKIGKPSFWRYQSHLFRKNVFVDNRIDKKTASKEELEKAAVEKFAIAARRKVIWIYKTISWALGLVKTSIW